jgi:hypothetical protein
MPLGKALVELQRRRKNPELQKKVEEYFASYPTLAPLDVEPRGVMARAIFSPIYELAYFLEMKRHLSMNMVYFEFSNDKFVAINSGKRCLGDMVFFKEGRWSGKKVTDSKRIIDFAKSEGHPLREIKTYEGQPLIEFHHDLLRKYFKQDLDIRDFSDWAKGSFQFSPELPYLRYLGLFVLNGILFEDFLTKDEHERPFTLKRVIPAYEKLVEIFGVPPLIVQLDPIIDDDRPFWYYYPESIKKLLL